MQQSPLTLRQRLIDAVDESYHVKDMGTILEVLGILEKLAVTKEFLETTRLGKTVNEFRKRINDDKLARRSKALVKKWRDTVLNTGGGPGQPPGGGGGTRLLNGSGGGGGDASNHAPTPTPSSLGYSSNSSSPVTSFSSVVASLNLTSSAEPPGPILGGATNNTNNINARKRPNEEALTNDVGVKRSRGPDPISAESSLTPSPSPPAASAGDGRPPPPINGSSSNSTVIINNNNNGSNSMQPFLYNSNSSSPTTPLSAVLDNENSSSAADVQQLIGANANTNTIASVDNVTANAIQTSAVAVAAVPVDDSTSIPKPPAKKGRKKKQKVVLDAAAVLQQKVLQAEKEGKFKIQNKAKLKPKRPSVDVVANENSRSLSSAPSSPKPPPPATTQTTTALIDPVLKNEFVEEYLQSQNELRSKMERQVQDAVLRNEIPILPPRDDNESLDNQSHSQDGMGEVKKKKKKDRKNRLGDLSDQQNTVVFPTEFEILARLPPIDPSILEEMKNFQFYVNPEPEEDAKPASENEKETDELRSLNPLSNNNSTTNYSINSTATATTTNASTTTTTNTNPLTIKLPPPDTTKDGIGGGGSTKKFDWGDSDEEEEEEDGFVGVPVKPEPLPISITSSPSPPPPPSLEVDKEFKEVDPNSDSTSIGAKEDPEAAMSTSSTPMDISPPPDLSQEGNQQEEEVVKEEIVCRVIEDHELDRFHQEKVSGLNGTRDKDGEFREWEEVCTMQSLNGDLFHILPYTIIDF